MACNVLIVDDSRMMRKVIRKSLAMSGFDTGDCWEAGDGEEALALIRTQRVDLILADVNMPVMNGLEMLRELRKDDLHRSIPVVFITTEGSEERLEEAKSLGVRGYLQKPFHPEALFEILNRIMEETGV